MANRGLWPRARGAKVDRPAASGWPVVFHDLNEEFRVSDLWRLSAVELAARIRRRDVSAVEATQSALARLQAVNPLINAVVDHRPDDALAQAAEVDRALARGEDPGALAGVPVTVKVEKINPKLKVIYYDTINLTHEGDEKTVVRFTIDSDGEVSDINTRPISLIREVRK